VPLTARHPFGWLVLLPFPDTPSSKKNLIPLPKIALCAVPSSALTCIPHTSQRQSALHAADKGRSVFSQWYDCWAAVLVFALFPWLCQYRMQCWTHYKHYSIGTAGTNGYLWESKYHWTTFGHDHRNSLFEGLTIDLTQPFISHWIRPVRGPILMILLYDLSPYPPYPEIPWLSVDLMRARGICYLKCEHPKTHASQNMSRDH